MPRLDESYIGRGTRVGAPGRNGPWPSTIVAVTVGAPLLWTRRTLRDLGCPMVGGFWQADAAMVEEVKRRWRERHV